MKTLYLLLIALSISAASAYDDLDKTQDINITEYGTQAAKDIRAIGRSYAYSLMNKNDFTEIAGDVVEITELPNDEQEAAYQDMAKEYVVFATVIGVGVLLFLFLLFGFLLSPCCMLCCNKSQKPTSTMSMWRIIWGSLLVLLLAANVAGILIALISGQQVLTLSEHTNDTIDTLGDGIHSYLSDTNDQLESLKNNQLGEFMGYLRPLVDSAIDNTVNNISTDATLTASVSTITQSLEDLDEDLTTAESTMTSIETKVSNLTAYVNTINGHMDTCKEAVKDNCGGGDCGDLTESKFATSFDTSELKADDISTVTDTIGEMQTFDGKTLTQWSEYVTEEWNNINETVKGNTTEATKAYDDTLNYAEGNVTQIISDDIQIHLTDAMVEVTTYQEDAKTTLTATLEYMKAIVLLQDPNPEHVPSLVTDITENEIVQWVIFGVFVFICVLAGLVILTVVIGLLSTIFGCCSVDDDLGPTERSGTSNCCGCLLMCTSYCSVILCAIATIAATILLMTVVVEEGICKQYDDGTLLSGIEQSLSGKINISEHLGEALNMTVDLSTEDLLESCKQSNTLVTTLGITQDTEIFGEFSINGIKDQITTAIDDFDVAGAVADIDIDFVLVDNATLTDLETNKDALTSDFDYAAVKSYLDTDPVSSVGDLSTAISDINTLIQGGKTDFQSCYDGMVETQTLLQTNGDVETVTTELKTLLTTMEYTAGNASEEVDSFVGGVTDMQNRLSGDYIPNTVEWHVTESIGYAESNATAFVDYLFGQFQTTVGSCQPLAAIYYTAFNYTCDNGFIHVTLLYLSLSLIGISLLFYMCISRCLARYFIRFSRHHPGAAEEVNGGWRKDHSLTPLGNNRVVYPDKLLLQVF